MIKKRIGIIGVSGFAKNHLNSIKYLEKECELVAADVRREDRCEADVDAMKALGAKIYENAYEMLEAEKNNIDIICIPTSIDSHSDYSVAAMKLGYDVICEKPVTGTIEEALLMKKTADETGRKLCIGFQNIFSPTIQKIKKIRIENKLGDLISCKSYATWPRSSAYYKRNAWAGKLIYNGKQIFDSPIQNATAHYLNNLLYIAGETHNESAIPEEVYGENFRAKNIESADTQFVRVKTKNNIKLTYIVTHSCKEDFGPVAEYLFENGKITWDFQHENDGEAKVFEKTGSEYKLIDKFDNGPISIHALVFKNMFEALDNKKQPLSNINNAYQHIISVNKSFESSNGITQIYEKYLDALRVEVEAYDPDLDVSNERNIVIKDIEKTIEKMYEQEKSFIEIGAEWAKGRME